MKTKSHKKSKVNEGLLNRSEQASTAKPEAGAETATQSKTASVRDANRLLSTERVLELLKRWMPRQFEIAEVVGKWVWIQFEGRQPRELTRQLSQLGFHWNKKRQAWQHPCGQFTSGTPDNPRDKYQSYFPADARRAA
jgi:hypothetical protein